MGRPKTNKRKRGEYGKGTICRTKEGYWVAAISYKDLNGKRKRLYKKARTEEEAQKRLQEAKEALKIVEGVQVSETDDTHNISLKELLEKLAEDQFQLPKHAEYKKPLTSRTVASYVWVASRIDEFMGDTRVKDITEEHIRFMLKIYRNGDESLGISPASQSFLDKLFYVTRIALDYAAQKGVIKTNVMRTTGEWSKPKAIKKPPRIKGYSQEEVKVMYAIFERQGLKWSNLPEEQRYKRPVLDLYTIFSLMLFTGMRSEEARALCWEDIDFQEGIISINKAMSLEYNIEKLKISEAGAKLGNTKNIGSIRDISVNQKLLEKLAMLREYNAQRQMGCGPTDLIFQSDRYKKAWTGNGLSKSLNDVLAFEGCQIRLAPHRLRHTCASIMETQKATSHEIMTQLGITQYSTVLVYTDRGKGIQRNNNKMIDQGISEEFGIVLQEE